MSASACVAARVAGTVVALGYLLGLVDGPIIGPLAGLALIAFGRSASSPRGAELVAPAAFGVVAGAAGAVALRWGFLDLPEIRGAQGVLGPTVLVDPVPVALSVSAALVAASLSLGASGRDEAASFLAWWWWIEGAVGALFLAGLFSGPPASDPFGALVWLGSAAGIASAGGVCAVLTAGWSVRARFILLGACGLTVTVAAAVAGVYP